MFRQVVAALLISLQTIGPAAAFSADQGQYFYRYTAGLPDAPITGGGEEATKDITAFYIAGVGEAFSQVLPMKPEWEDDDWRVVSGSLPSGITFNSSTLTFEGKATAVSSNMVANLKGYDASGNAIATASATFSVYDLPDQVVKVSFYHHTNQYASDSVTLPAGVTIDGDPTLQSPLPPGVTFNARYFDGTPTKAGTYPVLAFGYDYTHTKPIIAFKGTYVVEDGPTFASTVKDDLRKLAQSDYYGCSTSAECVVWYQEGIPKIKTPIKTASAVKYYVEVQAGDKLPGSLSFGSDPLNRQKNGHTYKSYDQATIRYKAVDIDDTVGYSNWFKIGSLGHQELCQPSAGTSSIALQGTVGSAFGGSAAGYAVPGSADATAKTYTLTSGTLPNGIKFDGTKGTFSGTPTIMGTTDGVSVTIAYPSTPAASPTICGPYQFKIAPTALSLTYSGLNTDYRVGDDVDVTIAAQGTTLAPSKIEMNTDAVLPTAVSFNPTTGKLSGKASEKGSFSATFVLTNGDGLTYPVSLAFSAHEALKVDDVPVISEIKRYDSVDPLFGVTYDPTTVIGNETWSINGGALPQGFKFDTGALMVSGGTCLPINKYGPYSVQLTDGTGQSAKTNDFYIDVTERAPIEPGTTVDPLTFSVNQNDIGQKPFSIIQPGVAATCLSQLHYTLMPSTLPDGLSFNQTTGYVSGLPTSKSTTPGYTVTVDEISPYNYSETSAPFSIVVGDPNAIQDQTLSGLQGNVGSNLSSVSPTPTLIKIRNSLVGFETAVVFDGSSPEVPGMRLNTATGILEGKPTAEFNGTVTIAYHDGGNRQGKLLLPVAIYPFPTLTSAQSVFEVPRLSDASNYSIQVTPGNTGFFNGVTYSLAPSSVALPAGLSLNVGTIVGNTDSPQDQSYAIVVRGTSKSDASVFVDYPITLKIVQEQTLALKLGLASDKLTWKVDETTFAVQSRDKFTSTKPTGSYVAPLVYSLPVAPSWMTIDANGQLGGTPKALGETTATVMVTDAENHSATDTATVKVTLSGYVTMAPGGNVAQVTLRKGESFKIDGQTVTNAVKPYALSVTGLPGTVDFNTQTGAFNGHIDTTGPVTWTLDALDADSRTTQNGYKFNYSVTPPVDIGNPVSSKNGRQYDPTQPISVQFPAPTNIMGKASYAVTGTVPGTLYYKFYDGDTPSGLATYIHYLADGTPTTVKQNPLDSTAKTEMQYLEPDHIIFDTLSRNLTGIPSKDGTFSIGLYVYDSYHDTGYLANPADSTRDDNNQATTKVPATITVAKALDMTVSNTAASETLNQYTSQPTLTSTVANDAYGLGVAWSPADGSGNLPNKVSMFYKTPQTLGYQGYPDTQGTSSNIQWYGYDWAGRKIVTDPVSFTVAPRLPLQLVPSSTLPRGMIVFDTDADLMVSAKNIAGGKSIGIANWTVSGAANLPPKVTYTITDNGVHFSGVSDTIGTYKDIIVSATDSLGGQASQNLTFKVISSSDPISLVVSDIKTKVGYPVTMAPPFATTPLSTDNSYGTLRFSSDDLPSGLGIALDPLTGALTGSVSTAQNIKFNLKVTDDTNRLTSQAVTVAVTPDLRLIAPTQVTATQGQITSTAIATDYALGTLTYAQGAGVWPVGFIVDPKTGNVTSSYTDPKTNKTTSNVVAATGTYPGLAITATDTFGNAVTTYNDQATSNTFAIVVNPTTAAPDIADQAKTVLGTQGTAIAAWYPLPANGWAGGVVERGNTANAWVYPGTVYTANYDLNKYGLTLDPSTGTISGTPTAPFIIRDFVMTVTSLRGDSDSTAPFWIGVAPKDAMVLNAKVPTTSQVRVGGTLTATALVWDNTLGNLNHTKVSGSSAFLVDATTGKLSAGTPSAGWAAGTYPVVIKVTDEFNRNSTTTITITVYPKLSVSATSATVAVSTDVTNVLTPTPTALIGTATYAITGLPTGLTFDPATGRVYGNVDSSKVSAGDYVATIGLADSFDSAQASTTATITVVKAYKYWRFTATTVKVHTSGDFLCLAELRWFAGTSDVSTAGNLTADSLYDSSKSVGQLVDGVYGSSGDFANTFCTGGLNGTPAYGTKHWIQLQLTNPAIINSLTIYDRRDGSTTTQPTAWSITKSTDGVNWENAWSAANSAMTANTVFTTKSP